MEKNEKYLSMFAEETGEHLKTINDLLLKLEDSPENVEALEEIFRSAHSIKGMAASLGFDRISDLTHILEDLFNVMRENPENITDDLLDTAFQAIDKLTEAVESIKQKEEHKKDFTGIIDKLKSFQEEPADENDDENDSDESEEILEAEIIAEPEEEKPEESGGEKKDLEEFRISLKISRESATPAARAMVAFKKIKSFSEEILSTEPPVEKLETDFEDRVLKITCLSAGSPSEFEKLIESLPDIRDSKIEIPSEEEPEEKSPEKKEDTIRIKTSLIDSIFNDIGELIVHHSRMEEALQQNDTESLSDTLYNFKRIIDRIYDEILSTRLMPFSYISSRFKRTVRSLKRELNKKINFEIEGEDVRLDRSILDELVDPINHMLRNSIDHGIEPPPERKKKGKSPEGKVSLQVTKSGEMINIQISDDGEGMNVKKIKDIALKKDLISKAEHRELSGKKALMLCTTPGFSTAEAVSDVSGRGVGMDVVRTKIENLGGHIEIESERDKGTTIHLDVPLTVAVTNCFLVKSSDLTYAFPVTRIKRTKELGRSDIRLTQGERSVDIRGENTKIYKLSNLLNISNSNGEFPERFPSLICERKEDLGAIAVDSILGTREVVVKPLGDPLEQIRQFSGATILGDGVIAPIVDVENLF